MKQQSEETKNTHARVRTHTTLLQPPSAQHAHMNPARARCL